MYILLKSFRIYGTIPNMWGKEHDLVFAGFFLVAFLKK
jgi:hypothetical protein